MADGFSCEKRGSSVREGLRTFGAGPPAFLARPAGGVRSDLRGGVERLGERLGDLVDRTLNLRADHHAHHHVQVDVQHQPHPRVVGCHLFELQPEGEIHRYAAVAADDLDRLGRLLFGDAQLHGEAFGLERTGVFVGLPLLDPVGQGGGEVVESADDVVDLLRRAADLLLAGGIFLHDRSCFRRSKNNDFSGIVQLSHRSGGLVVRNVPDAGGRRAFGDRRADAVAVFARNLERSSVDDHRAGRVPCDAVGVDDIGAVDAQEAVVELLLPLRNLGLGA